MGMAASQARLLSITARLTDNEQTGQALSYAKERLADKTEQVTTAYNNALAQTKLQVMTGYSDGDANYTDVSFAILSSPQVLDLGRQYIVTDTKGKVLVQPNVAQAYLKANGNINMFLGQMGYSISDVDPAVKANDTTSTQAQKEAIEEEIHQAWDRYFVSIGKTFVDESDQHAHHWSFAYLENDNGEAAETIIGDGFAIINVDKEESDGTLTNVLTDSVINYEGTNQEQLALYNRAMALTESYYSEGRNFTDSAGDSHTVQAHNLTNVKTNYDKANTAEIKYYTNLFNKMLSSGFYSYTNTASDAQNDPQHWIYQNPTLNTGASSQTGDGSPLTDSNTFEQYLKSGKLILESFSSTKNKFVSVSLAEDTCFQEVEDKTAIAAAEAKYNNDLEQIERLDTRYDLQLKRLDTEHNTLQTEYESVKKVLTNNVQNSFKTFS